MDIPGWRLVEIGYEHNDVGSWLLHSDDEAMLLEVPPNHSSDAIEWALADTETDLKYVTASHLHEDHLDDEWWAYLQTVYPRAEFIKPKSRTKPKETCLYLGQEPLWLVQAPKHSHSDVITIFRGIAMTGDVELGTLESCNNEVDAAIKAASMRFFADFQKRTGYHVHTTMSAHQNSFRTNVDWPKLFRIP